MMRWTTVTAALALSVSACQSEAHSGAEGVAHSIDTVAVIGALADSTAATLGSLDGVLETSFGDLIVLDATLRRLVRFDTAGTVLGTIGRAGQGPGEFVEPGALVAGAEDRVGVFDNGRRRLIWFEVQELSLAFVREDEIDVGGRFACAMDDGLWVSSLTYDRVLHQLSYSGRRIQSALEPVKAQPLEALGMWGAVALGVTAPGPLLCLPDQNLVLAVPTSAPSVVAFRPNQGEIWRATLADFSPLLHRVTDAGALIQQPVGSNGVHLARSAAPWTDTSAVVQYQVRRDASSRLEIESRVLRLTDGKELERLASLPVLLGTTERGLLLGKQDWPFPALLLLRRR